MHSSYIISSSGVKVTSGLEFTKAVPYLWENMPEISEIIEAYGLPPELAFGDVQNGSHLNLRYATGTLYFGPSSNEVIEIRFRSDDGYVLDGVSVGSAVDEVVKAFGEPLAIVEGENQWKNNVLYIMKQGGYIQYNDLGIRFFFSGSDPMIVNAMYLFRPGRYDTRR